jgi:glycosyltransferase involved in cell wall biosynthesis
MPALLPVRKFWDQLQLLFQRQPLSVQSTVADHTFAYVQPFPQSEGLRAEATTAGRTLVTVSTTIDPALEKEVLEQRLPRIDYFEFARAFQADLIDYEAARRQTGWVGRLLEWIGGPNLTLAYATYRQSNHYKVIFTDGEHIGIPLAFFCKLSGRRPRHLMLTHVLSVYKKMIFFDLFHIQSHIDLFIVYSSRQRRFIEERWHLPETQIAYTPFTVDTVFYSQDRITVTPRRMICSAGRECRDYPTLIEAVRDLDLDVVIAAGSPYSKRRDTTKEVEIPANVLVDQLGPRALRQAYADSLFVVVPLYDVDFQAGVTVILEAMSMGKAIICSRTRGQTDVVVHGETGLYVEPGNPAALRAAIEQLLHDPELTKRMGEAGRRRAETLMSLDRYTERLTDHVQRALLS